MNPYKIASRICDNISLKYHKNSKYHNNRGVSVEPSSYISNLKADAKKTMSYLLIFSTLFVAGCGGGGGGGGIIPTVSDTDSAAPTLETVIGDQTLTNGGSITIDEERLYPTTHNVTDDNTPASQIDIITDQNSNNVVNHNCSIFNLIYTTPGTYTMSVWATDSAKNVTKNTYTITVLSTRESTSNDNADINEGDVTFDEPADPNDPNGPQNEDRKRSLKDLKLSRKYIIKKDSIIRKTVIEDTGLRRKNIEEGINKLKEKIKNREKEI